MTQQVFAVINLPGKFTDFLEGTSEISGDNGKTPLYVAYKENSRTTKRGRGYTVEITFAFEDAEVVREALITLREQAENCIYFNQDVMDDEQARSEVKAAKLVIERVDELLKTLPEATPEPVVEPVAAPVAQVRHKSATEIINGFTSAQHARLLCWFAEGFDDMLKQYPDIHFASEVEEMREVVRRDWNQLL